jgi:hypothetical protein
MSTKDKSSIEIFVENLDEKEKLLLCDYVKNRTFESLSKKFDDLLSDKNENK